MTGNWSALTPVKDPDFTEAERAHAEQIVTLVGPIIEPLALALAPKTEVLLHNLTQMPNTIAVIAGGITGRGIGGPATDLGLRTFSSGWSEPLIGYRTETDDGHPMRSSSIFFKAESGRPVACLCINTDISEVLRAQEMLKALSAITTIDPSLRGAETVTEKFPASVDDLAQGILAQAVAESGLPVTSMKKTHKVEIVRQLRDRGFFTMREAVPIAAQHLGVGRHTIYNYLNEIEQELDQADA
ncbi:PAS domain-containing protein [Leucobacter sp. UT-8R-CII-1-4]|uniref:helix-turn-helix transcriptional regulator n=1 Tax=Leucobacter sp. UT-8R-CII-1-4 TaxID=3040075 RepID=UPI0024A97091|nr:PAS domain-containing protein [Leucobacter sp. UT-8R-CII-1-4]MDI6022663.1 PAS domain-containing protein [Leucobacter sp. UT-8R-CII-1-4]